MDFFVCTTAHNERVFANVRDLNYALAEVGIVGGGSVCRLGVEQNGMGLIKLR